jgi:hypothetical protein
MVDNSKSRDSIKKRDDAFIYLLSGCDYSLGGSSGDDLKASASL